MNYLKIGAFVALALLSAWLYAGRADALRQVSVEKARFVELRDGYNQRALEQMESNNRDALIRMRNNERIADAQQVRDELVQKQLADAARANRGLRATIDSLEKRPTPDDAEARAYAHEASVARGIVQQCSERYRWVDGEAKKLSSQVIGLQSYVNDVCLVEQGAANAADPLDQSTPDKVVPF